MDVRFLGIDLVGLNAETGKKLLLSVVLVGGVELSRRIVRRVFDAVLHGHKLTRARFWVRQALSILAALAIIVGMASVWFDDPERLTTALGLVTAGLAFALQKVVTALAGYLVVMRGKTFSIGDRIVMGGVRGDVIDLGFIQTTIMEMGQPPGVTDQTDPAMWVQSRQYSGRVVTISNASVFDEPVYNYTREFPYLWEEMRVPIAYSADHGRVERLMVDVVNKHTHEIQQVSDSDKRELERRYMTAPLDTRPTVYYRMTDNWVELTIRFLVKEHGIRELKDAITRDLLTGLNEAGIAIASTTFEIVGLPPLRLAPIAPVTPTAAQ